MVGHQAVGKQVDRVSFQALRQDALERLIVVGLVEDPHSSVPTIENVINHPSFCRSSGSGHRRIVSSLDELVNQ
jgi:hypothetical protein